MAQDENSCARETGSVVKEYMDNVTKDHTEIKRWAEKHGGKPQIIDNTTAQGDK